MEANKEVTVDELKNRQKQEAELAKHYVSPSKYRKIAPNKIHLKAKKKRARKLARKIRKQNPHKK